MTKDLLPAPRTIDDALQTADLLAHSQLIPKAFQGRPADIVVAMMWSHSLDIPIVQGLQYICVINGRPSMYGDGLLAVVMSSGQCTDFKEEFVGEGDHLMAKCTVRRRGLESPIIGTFSMEDARVAGLLGKPGPWKQYPKRMLKMRARAFALRDAFPDILSGMSSAEEMADVEGVAVEKVEEPEPQRKMPRRKKAATVAAPQEAEDVQSHGLEPVQEPAAAEPVEAPEAVEPEAATVVEPDPDPKPQADAQPGFTRQDVLIADINVCESRASLIALWRRLKPEEKANASIMEAFTERQNALKRGAS